MAEDTDDTRAGDPFAALTEIQRAAAERLASFPALEGAGIVALADGSPADRCAEALAKTGACLLVAAPSCGIRSVNAPLLRIDPLRVTVTAVVSPALRAGPGRSAEEWAARCAAALLLWQPPGCARPLAAPAGDAVRSDERGGYASATLTLETTVTLPLYRRPGEWGAPPA